MYLQPLPQTVSDHQHVIVYVHVFAAAQIDSSSGRDKQSAEAKAGKIKLKRDDALDKASAIEVAPLPKIEVRLLLLSASLATPCMNVIYVICML